MFVEGEHGPAGEDVIDRVGAILAGRRSWDPKPALAADERTAKPYGGRWSGPIVVLTHRPEEAPDDPGVTFVSSGVEAALDLAFEKAQGKDVVLFGAPVTAQAEQFTGRGRPPACTVAGSLPDACVAGDVRVCGSLGGDGDGRRWATWVHAGDHHGVAAG
jgi:hypothetical protein